MNTKYSMSATTFGGANPFQESVLAFYASIPDPNWPSLNAWQVLASLKILPSGKPGRISFDTGHYAPYRGVTREEKIRLESDLVNIASMRGRTIALLISKHQERFSRLVEETRRWQTDPACYKPGRGEGQIQCGCIPAHTRDTCVEEMQALGYETVTEWNFFGSQSGPDIYGIFMVPPTCARAAIL